MTLEEMIARARLLARDTDTQKPLWTDDEFTDYANRALNEACRRARLIVDSSTDDVTLLQFAAGEATAPRDHRILFIRRARVVGAGLLGRVSYKTLDEHSERWEEESGPPRGYVTDFDTGLFRVYPIPAEDIQVRLTVVRIPLKPLAQGADVPEIGAHLHHALVEGMLDYAYGKVDSETYAPDRAAKHAAAFTLEFGPPSTAIDETWLDRNHDLLPDEGNF